MASSEKKPSPQREEAPEDEKIENCPKGQDAVETAQQAPDSAGSPNGEDEAAAPSVEDEAEKLRKEMDALNERMLRLMAEYDNYRKRTAREKDAIYPDAVAATVEKFLPVLDNFQRALEAPCSDEEFKKGMAMICDGLVSVLTGLGVEPVGQVGEEFSPTLHNAVMHVDDESLGKNVVAQVFQKGYRIGDRILRYAMVQQAN